MVAASLSLKGVLFFLFVVLFPLTLQVRLRRKLLVAAVGGLLCVGAYMAVPTMPMRLQRFAMVFTSPDELRPTESAFLRSWLIVEGLNVSMRNPAFGVGVDNARFVLIPAGGKWATSDLGIGSHSNYIEMLLNAGIIGWLLHYLPLLYIYARINGRHPYYRATTTLTALYLLLGIAMVQYNVFVTVLLYSLIIFLYLYYRDVPQRSYDARPSRSGRSVVPLPAGAYR
jgi:O-antigen ligase